MLSIFGVSLVLYSNNYIFPNKNDNFPLECLADNPKRITAEHYNNKINIHLHLLFY
jgi:hypothetical protein